MFEATVHNKLYRPVTILINNDCQTFLLLFQEVDKINLRIQVLTAMSMKTNVFCDIAPCNLVEIDRHRSVYEAEYIL
jgi:hypothetical protein